MPSCPWGRATNSITEFTIIFSSESINRYGCCIISKKTGREKSKLVMIPTPVIQRVILLLIFMIFFHDDIADAPDRVKEMSLGITNFTAQVFDMDVDIV